MSEKKINLKNWKSSIKDEIAAANERIGSDFMNAFEWGYHEKRYEAEFKIKFLSYFKEDISLEDFENEIKKQIFNCLPLHQSTSSSSNRADILKLNSLKELLANAMWNTIK